MERDNCGQKRDKKRYRCTDEDYTEIQKMGLKEVGINLDKQKIERDSGGQERDKNRYR